MFFAAILSNTLSGRPRKPDSLARGDYAYLREHISWLARRAMKKHQVAGMSIALVDDDRTVWSAGFGFADQRERVAATADTVYRVGSITKLFTATAIMGLAEQRRLDIDHPVQRYLPEFAMKSRFADAAPITLRHLLSHHSGLPTDHWKGMWGERTTSLDALIAALQEEYVAYPPEYIGSYSNIGYALLGLIVQRVSGQDFAAYVEATVLRPLGMTYSGFAIPGASRGRMASGYRNGRPELQRLLRDTSAGGLCATAVDLAKFMQSVWRQSGGEQALLSAQTVAQMLTVQYPDIALDIGPRFGLGWSLDGIEIHGGGLVAAHSGGTPLFHSMLMMLPEQRLGVVVLANSAEAREAVDRVALETLALALETKSGIARPKPRLDRARPTRLSVAAAEAMAGTYATASGVLHIENRGRRLRARHGGRMYTLIPHDDGAMEVVYRVLGVLLIRPPAMADVKLCYRRIDGCDVLLLHSRRGTYLFGCKTPLAGVPPTWVQRLGRYALCNPDPLMPVEDVQLRQIDDVLVFTLRLPLFVDKPVAIPLQVLSDDEAITAGIGRGKGETLRIVGTGDDLRLRYSGYEFRAVAEARAESRST